MQGTIIKVSGPLIVASGMADVQMYDVVRVSEKQLIGEVIELRGDQASIQDDIDLVNRVIFEELCLGIVKEESRAEYLRVIAALQRRGAQGILLGCTELGLIVAKKDVLLPLFDTTEIHAKKALTLALSK